MKTHLKRRTRLIRFTGALLGLMIAVASGIVPVGAGTPAAAVPAASGWEAGPKEYGVSVETDVPVAMSDGVVLKVDVHYPTDPATGKRAEGSFPVLLEQSPYPWHRTAAGSADPRLDYAEYFVSRGYIAVIAQVRGTWRSGGEFCLMCDRERQDGVELVDWAAHQLPGSDGRLGLTGCSYTGVNQYFTAALVGKNSPVKAITPAGFGAYFYREAFFMGGVPTTLGLGYFSALGGFMGTASAAAYGAGLVADITSGGDRAYDRAYWQHRTAGNYIDDIVGNGIPALVASSWSDTVPTAVSEAYALFQNAAAGRDIWQPMAPRQKPTSRYQLLMGDGDHCSGGLGGWRDEAALRWYDTWVKGENTGMLATSTPMHMVELGSKRWVDAATYPLVSDYQTYYLNAGGELTKTRPDVQGAADRISYGPPETDGTKVTYTTEPITQGATLAGPVALSVQASSSNTNMQLFVNLFDVAPDGTATALTTGGLIGSLRTLDPSRTWHDKEGRLVRPYSRFTVDEPMVAGKVTQLDVQIAPRLAAIEPGHRLRLELQTQSSTGCVGHLCMRPTVPQESTLSGGQYQIQRNRVWASQLNVPLLPYLHYNTSAK